MSDGLCDQYILAWSTRRHIDLASLYLASLYDDIVTAAPHGMSVPAADPFTLDEPLNAPAGQLLVRLTQS